MSDLTTAVFGTVGALLGAAMGGGFTLLKGRQEARQTGAAWANERHERRHEHRMSSYSRLLEAYQTLDTALAEAWSGRAAGGEAHWAASVGSCQAALLEVGRAEVSVVLAGPEALADNASRLLLVCREEVDKLHRLRESDPSGRLINQHRDSPEYRDALIARQQVHSELTAAARRNLGGNVAY